MNNIQISRFLIYYSKTNHVGKFLVAESKGESYLSRFIITKPIKLQQLGNYEFVFYTIFNTPLGTDSLSIQVKYEKENSFENIYSISNPADEIMWKRQAVPFIPRSKSFQIQFEFSRTTNGPFGFISFDNITLYHLSSDGIITLILFYNVSNLNDLGLSSLPTDLQESTTTFSTTDLIPMEPQKPIFACNFDTDTQCGGASVFNSLNLAVTSQFFLTPLNRVVTDVTSICKQ